MTRSGLWRLLSGCQMDSVSWFTLMLSAPVFSICVAHSLRNLIWSEIFTASSASTECRSQQSVFCILCVCVLFQCPCLSAFIFLFFFKRWGARMSSRRRCPLSVLCGRAQPSQPQSWHGSLPGRIAGLSQLPLQLSGALKSGQRGSETLVGLYDGGPVATIAHTQTHTHTDKYGHIVTAVQSRLNQKSCGQICLLA